MIYLPKFMSRRMQTEILGGRRIAEIVRAKLKKLLAEKKPIACDCETKSVVQSLAASPADVWLTFTMIVLGVACGAVFFMGILLKRPRPITEEAHEVLPEEGVSGQVSEGKGRQQNI